MTLTLITDITWRCELKSENKKGKSRNQGETRSYKCLVSPQGYIEA